MGMPLTMLTLDEFLAWRDDASSYTTGAVLAVDGGHLAGSL